MADNLIFPIGFDLEKGIKDALTDGDKALDRIERILAKRPITIKLRMDTKAARGASAELAGFRRQLAELTQQWNSLTAAERGGAAGAAIREKFRALRTEAQGYTSTLQAAVKAEDKMRESHTKTAASANKLSSAYQSQSAYLSRLIQRMAAYASLSYVSQFLTSVREVTAEFELQRVSLGAIIQDQTRANQLFSEIKTFALESPLKILDLTKYTKQLAAYRIETDQLFDTTKRLADISVGLGVSMDRLILAYGQVKATGYLRGCLGKGTLVKMFDGSNKKVEDIVVGDIIMGDDEQGRNILSLIRNRETMYSVKYNSGSFRCNENHILTLYNTEKDCIEDIYVLDYLKCPTLYKGVRRTDSKYEYFDITVEREREDDYFGFEIDGNKRFIIENNVVTHNSEVRQFTEAGLGIVDALAEKLTQANGELVRASDVMDMISKREIPFEMVAEIFEDMTDKGGMFYDMQRKQGDTLYGMWQKLGDAAAMMYEQIGNSGAAQHVMKELIELLRSLMLNWKRTGAVLLVGAAAAAKVALSIKSAGLATQVASAANIQYIATLRAKNAEHLKALATEGKLNMATRLRTQALILANRAQIAAASSSNLLTRSFYKLTAAMLSNPITAIVTALGALAAWLWLTDDATDKLSDSLDEINGKYADANREAESNFRILADRAVEAADGSAKQKDALDELSRTYGNIIPQELLTIENLRAMKGEYGELTDMIKKHNLELQKTDWDNAVKESFAEELKERKEDFEEELKDIVDDITSAQIQTASLALQEAVDAGLDIETTRKYIAQELWKSMSSIQKSATSQAALYKEVERAAIDYTKTIYQMNDALVVNQQKLDEIMARLNPYGDYLARITNYGNRLVDQNGGILWQNQEDMDLFTADMFNELQDLLKEAKVNVGDGWYEILETWDSGAAKVVTVNMEMLKTLTKHNPKLYSIISEIAKYYEGMVPSDPVVYQLRNKLRYIVNETGADMQKLGKFLWDGSESIDENLKKLDEQVSIYEAEIYRIKRAQANGSFFSKIMQDWWNDKLEEDEKMLKGLVALRKATSFYVKPDDKGKRDKRGGGAKSDTRLQNLKEEISLLQKLYAEYKKLEKQEGAARAAEDMRKLAGKTIDMFKTKYKIDLPTNADNLASSLEILYKKMEALGTKAFPTLPKDLAELRWTIENVKIEDLQKNIEAELKRLADRISRTKTAKEFYDKVLGMTGDIQLSANLAVSVYGQNGQDLQDAIREQIITAFETDPEKKVTIDLSEAIDPDTGAINYNKLAELEEKYKDVLISGRADLRKKLIDEGRKTSEAQVQQWLKDIEKAKDFAQQRIDLATYTANQIAAINARTDLPQADKDKLTKGYQDREAKLLAKLQYDEFKNSEMYIHIFEDLDHASTTALKNMRDRLVALKGQWQNLDPTQVKELTKAIADLDEQIAGRSPFKSIIDGFKGLADARPQKVIDAEMIAATDELAKREEFLAAATKKLTEAQTAQINAQAEVAQARQDLEDALAVSGGEETAEVKAAREVLGIKIATFNAIKAASKDSISAAKTEVDKAAEKYEEQKKVIDALVAEGKIREANIKKIELANQEIDKYQQQINEALDGVRKMMEAFGASEEDMQFFDDVVGALNEIVDAGQQAAMSVASFKSGNILEGITSGVSAIGGLVSGFTNLFSAGKVRKANKEIKRQAELLEQLEYTYGQLEASADKLFGRDYLNNYNQQLKVLQAQQKAYLKQAEAERSKGKKADKEKIKEYENQARDTANAIKKMQDDLVAHFTGSSKTDVARQMAQSWIEARVSMSDSFAAIKGDFQDLIKNLIVEGAAARVIENALTPMWNDMEKMLADNDVEGAIDSLVNGMDAALTQANDGMEVLWKALEARGYDMKQLVGDVDSEYTGIAKNVAGATSEEINTVAAIGNTVMYHTSHLPIISQNLAAIYELMSQGKTTTLPGSGAAGWTDWQQQAMENYNAIARNTAATVVECRRAAVACEAATEKLNRAFRAKGGTSGFNVFLNS